MGIRIGVVEIECVAQAEIEPQSVELRQRPQCVDVQLWADDDVILFIGFGEVDVVVIFGAYRSTDAKPDWTRQEVIRKVFDVLLARFRGGLTSQRRPDRILRSSNWRCAQNWEQKNESDLFRQTRT